MEAYLQNLSIKVLAHVQCHHYTYLINLMRNRILFISYLLPTYHHKSMSVLYPNRQNFQEQFHPIHVNLVVYLISKITVQQIKNIVSIDLLLN